MAFKRSAVRSRLSPPFLAENAEKFLGIERFQGTFLFQTHSKRLEGKQFSPSPAQFHIFPVKNDLTEIGLSVWNAFGTGPIFSFGTDSRYMKNCRFFLFLQKKSNFYVLHNICP